MHPILQKIVEAVRWKDAPARGTATVVGPRSSLFGTIHEPFTGAWQQNVALDAPRSILAFSGVYACVSLIAGDIAKMRLRLMRRGSNKVWTEVSSGHELIALLRKPNRYQTRLKFMEQYITSKLLWGNAYVLKARDASGAVFALYVLDPQRVTVLVAPDGSVWYQLATDNLVPLADSVTVPASEIIHDTMICLWHPLCGVSPIYACAMSATQGNRIQENSQQFFANMSRPSGVLTAPGAIKDETAIRIKTHWETNFGGSKIGKLAVLGDGLTYEPMVIPAHDAQLIEQLEWTVQDVARAFHMPIHKIGGPVPAGQSVESLQQTYYTDCLQVIVESTELAFDASFGLPEGTETEFDLDALLRMDSVARFERGNKAIAGGWLAPNEQRLIENYPPAEGGDSPMMQQQNWSLAQLAQRSGPADAPSVAAPPPQALAITLDTKDAAPSETQSLAALAALFTEGLREEAREIDLEGTR